MRKVVPMLRLVWREGQCARWCPGGASSDAACMGCEPLTEWREASSDRRRPRVIRRGWLLGGLPGCLLASRTPGRACANCVDDAAPRHAT